MIKEIKKLGVRVDENTFEPLMRIQVILDIPMQKVWDGAMTEEEMIGEIAKSIMELIKSNPR